MQRRDDRSSSRAARDASRRRRPLRVLLVAALVVVALVLVLVRLLGADEPTARPMLDGLGDATSAPRAEFEAPTSPRDASPDALALPGDGEASDDANADEPADAIRGRVRWRSGADGPQGLIVAAWMYGRPPRADADADAEGDAGAEAEAEAEAEADAENASTGAPLLRALTDRDGRFVLDGTRPGARYTVLVAGEGVSAARVDKVASDEAALELVVEQELALDVTLRAPSGEALDPAAFRDGRAVLAWNVPRGLDVDVPSPLVERIEAPATDGALDPVHVRVRFRRLEPSDEPGGPIQIGAHYPGFARANRELLVPVATQPPAHVDWTLEPADTPRGVLLVDLVLSAWGRAALKTLQTGDPPDPLAVGVIGSGCPRYPLRDVGRTRWTLTDLLCEPSIVQLCIPGVAIPVVPTGMAYDTQVPIGPSPTSVTFDLLGRGGLEAHLLLEDGSEYGDDALLLVSDTSGHFKAFAAFHEPPYLVAFLPPGEYDVTLRAPHHDDPRRVAVRADATSVVEFPLDD
ncbi:MAG: carboxypeptidase regulatory-like domain-containing protein [Planctomycetes bacterium]|nr:carboxypeptidase regulatory-like domain-containing protein [Planctomycetota bacterium]